MSSWDTNPWSNFCDPHWKLICRNKWHPGTSEISTPSEVAVGTHSHARHCTKTISAFLPADGEASWSLLPSSISLLSGGTVKPENAYSCNLKVTGQVYIYIYKSLSDITFTDNDTGKIIKGFDRKKPHGHDIMSICVLNFAEVLFTNLYDLSSELL